MIILTHELLELITDNNAFIVLVKSIAKRANYGNQSCFPSIATMEKDTGFSRNTVITACKWLKDKGIITVVKRKNEKGGDTSNLYVVETDLIKIVGKLKVETPVQNLNPPSSKYELPPVQNMNTNHKHILTTSTTNQKKEKKFNAFDYLNSLDIDSEIKTLLLDWLEVRKTKKTPTTQKAIDLAIKKLSEYDKIIQKQMVENSIMNGWTGIFDIREEKIKKVVDDSPKPAYFAKYIAPEDRPKKELSPEEKKEKEKEEKAMQEFLNNYD